MVYGTHSGKQLSPLTDEKGNRLKWWHKIDLPTVEILRTTDLAYAELYWPDRVRHRGSVAIAECEEGKFRFDKSQGPSGVVKILKDETDQEAGQVRFAIAKPSEITLSGGRAYHLRNEGFLKEEWVLLDEHEEALFRIKRVFPDVEVSGEIEVLSEGRNEPQLPLLMAASWYVVH